MKDLANCAMGFSLGLFIGVILGFILGYAFVLFPFGFP